MICQLFEVRCEKCDEVQRHVGVVVLGEDLARHPEDLFELFHFELLLSGGAVTDKVLNEHSHHGPQLVRVQNELEGFLLLFVDTLARRAVKCQLHQRHDLGKEDLFESVAIEASEHFH